MRGQLAAPLLMLSLAVTPLAGSAQGERRLKPLERARVDGIELEYEVRGSGEPVVLVHAGIFADWFAPLLAESTLTSRYRVVSYHRVGYAGSSHLTGPVNIADQARHLRGLLHHLGIARTHVVGHSSGGNIALQLAIDAPDVVASLALLEPAVPLPPADTPAPEPGPSGLDAVARMKAGDRAGAVDVFMQFVAGSDYRAPLERAIPGAFQQGVADADSFFGQELPAVRTWTFGPDDARRVTQPVFAVTGERSASVSKWWPRRQKLLTTSLLNVEPFVLHGATHLLHVEQPRMMAEALVGFFGKHPIERK